MRIRLADTTLYVTAATRRAWRADGPALLGLHGGPGVDGSLLRYYLGLQQEWATVVVPDQRGHGYSDLSTREHWNLGQWAEDIRQLIEVLGLADVILVGTSFGGFVAQRFLAAYPNTVRGAVIIGSSARRASKAQIVERYRAFGGDEAAEVMDRTLRDPSPEVEEQWSRVCGPLARLRPTDAVLDTILHGSIRTPEVNEHFMATFDDMDLRAELANVQDPMLVLVGARDPLTPPDTAAEIQRYSGGAVTFQTVEAASHHVLWDQPERSDELLRAFAHSVKPREPED